ncbi:Galactose-6-sulfurylase [Ascochyta rabiei]|uniref:Protein farnesyltransferase/geranylgeranyltransferase type-1 subunit alpha n=1 Tax=Didymella rabiei TaxID=5454 RepID=A0A163DC08_DIDRA|nr:Galactose-6-sulfurylase [Ascochyta rabiei]KZM23060.1 protein prenyltransferase [Ascochyta rabiei]UPX17891.1 Galactose-6-sulfurylase [Ascochyta rabiei]
MSLQLIRSFIANIFVSPFHVPRVILAQLRNTLQASSTDAMPPPRFYHDDEAWKDVEPLPQDDGGMHPLAAIAYTEEYSEAMGYLRAVMASNEFSDRVLGLTEHIINMNPAHYTVWLYRAKTISELGKPLQDEIKWLNPTALKHLKNYQIWHHRQTIIDALGSPEGEADFVSKMLEKDEKNYHVWSYRQWLVQRFDLFDKPEELEWTESMIDADVRNNSAWNHRYYLVVGGRGGNAPSEHVTKHEIAYTKEAIRKAPQNQSSWNYLMGILRAAQLPKSTVKDFVTEFADIESPDDVYSSHALDLLADIYAEEENNKESAERALDLLATRYDPIRANYWNYRKGLLSQPEVAA